MDQRLEEQASSCFIDAVSQIAEDHIQSQLDSYFANLRQQEEAEIPSLTSLTADLILQELEESEDVDTATRQ